jgi:hypothetical protein
MKKFSDGAKKMAILQWFCLWRYAPTGSPGRRSNGMFALFLGPKLELAYRYLSRF